MANYFFHADRLRAFGDINLCQVTFPFIGSGQVLYFLPWGDQHTGR